MDAHAEDEIGAGPRPQPRLSAAVSGLKATPDAEPVLARRAATAAEVVRHLVVEGDAVAAGCGDLLEVARRVVDHQVAVDAPPAAWIDRRDRAQDDRPDRDRRDEVAVADVEVEDADAGARAATAI